MKKMMYLLVSLVLLVSAFAQLNYPVPTLVEGNIYNIQQKTPELQQPMLISETPVQNVDVPLTPSITNPTVEIPMKYKQSCSVNCLKMFTSCTRDGYSVSYCKSVVYENCIVDCPVEKLGDDSSSPQLAYPTNFREQCRNNCDSAYRRCLSAGGSVDACSRSVLNPCQSKCNREYPKPDFSTPMPDGLSCIEECEWQVKSCFASDSEGCGVFLDDCKSECPQPVKAAQPSKTPAMQNPAITVVPENLSCGEKCGILFDSCLSQDISPVSCREQMSYCLDKCSPVLETPAPEKSFFQKVWDFFF